jgi:polyferredoxin
MHVDGTATLARAAALAGRLLAAPALRWPWGLLALFTLLPYGRVAGKPAILLDVAHRRFTLLGTTFLATDTMLLALLLVGIFVSIFLLTALLGRVWCGWACPQTVYLEFVYRPLERLFGKATGPAAPPSTCSSPPSRPHLPRLLRGRWRRWRAGSAGRRSSTRRPSW